MFVELMHSSIFIRKIAEYVQNSKAVPIISFVVPVFNQESVIREHLIQIVTNSSLIHEIIIINDSSSDKSRDMVLEFISDIKNGADTDYVKTIAVSFFETRIPWYETKCDDFGIGVAKSNFIIEIQADMKIKEKDFDHKLLKILSTDDALFAISGRGTHKISELSSSSERRRQSLKKAYFLFRKKMSIKRFLYKLVSENSRAIPTKKSTEITSNQDFTSEIFPSPQSFENNGRAGFLGTLIEKVPYDGDNLYTRQIKTNSGKIWIGETVMRGPLLLRKDYYKMIGGFNTKAFFLGNDDHDLFIRAKDFGLKVGYSPVVFASPLNLGSTRKGKKTVSEIFYLFNSWIREKSFFESTFYMVTKDN